MIRSPIKWVGGKSKLRKSIVPMLPKHECYVEVFGGAAWVLFGKAPSPVEVLNDIDSELINFFRVVKENPNQLIDAFRWDLVSRAEFNRLLKLDLATLTTVERAHRFYYLIMASWGGELGSARFQTSITDGGHGNRLFGALQSLEQRILPAYNRLRTVIIENLPWRQCINQYDSRQTMFYLDPPYPGNKVNYQYNMRAVQEHTELLELLQSIRGKWLLTTYDTEEMRKMYTKYNFHPIEFASGMAGNSYRNIELCVTNYSL